MCGPEPRRRSSKTIGDCFFRLGITWLASQGDEGRMCGNDNGCLKQILGVEGTAILGGQRSPRRMIDNLDRLGEARFADCVMVVPDDGKRVRPGIEEKRGNDHNEAHSVAIQGEQKICKGGPLQIHMVLKCSICSVVIDT